MTNSRLFVLAGLLITLGLALFVSPWASSEPDGLERVAEDQGFRETAREHPLADSPVADYQVRGVEGERTSTALSGLIGTLLTFGLGTAIFALSRMLRGREREPR